LQAYARFLLAQTPNPVDPSEVVTRLKFDTKSESPKLFFKAMRWLNDDEYPNIVEKGQSPEAQKAITMSVAKMDNVAAPLAIGGKRPTAKVVEEEEEETPAPAPKAKKAKAEPVAEDDGEEPTVRKEEKKPSAVPAKKSSLAAMVDDWDE